MQYGVRAAFVLLRRYIRHYKRDNISSIISSWAPSNENNTVRYIDQVASELNMSSLEPILYEDKETMVRLFDAMCYVECGTRIKREIIERGYDLA